MPSSAMALGAICFVFLFGLCAGDTLVQLNVNRPFNDVNEKFVSFTVRPEDLYKALDGDYRKSMTRMANMLGESYIRFTGEYHFTSKPDSKLRNPTKVIWKGFNRWSSAINWTMIIPIPYSPNSWDPMDALKILNTSYLIGISDCIWQLGTDFGSSRAKDYVAELNTLNLMVDTFRPYVNDWQLIGADVSAGSSAEETRRYIEMSKDVNAAFGWTQPSELMSANSLNHHISDNDPALKMMLTKKVPVWLSLPHKPKRKRTHQNSHRMIADETVEAMRWAQTMGEAANIGFDAIFKRMSLADLENPTYSFYVTALFKKVMGSRVFPARPLNMLVRGNKLYTHCANDVSGGIAFMVINPDDTPMQITVRSMTKFKSTEVWQYTLTFINDTIQLNNEELTLNSSLAPQIRDKHADRAIQLNTPAKSISFWVLPTVNLDHCQFTEIETGEISKESGERHLDKRYSSSDRLLQKLIQETSLSHSALTKAINRRRRYATFSKKPKHLLIENNADETTRSFQDKIFRPFKMDDKMLKKPESDLTGRHKNALQWIEKLWDNPIKKNPLRLKRQTRSADNYFGPYFVTRNGRKTTITKKITEIKKPERQLKPIFDFDEFDEEEYFKKVGNQPEPQQPRFPEGDVHIRHITNVDGDEVDESRDERRKAQKKSKAKTPERSKEAVSEMKPLRLLPTEFYEALPVQAFKPAARKMNIGSALNTLLFPEPFKKNFDKEKKAKGTLKNQKPEERAIDAIPDVEEVGTGKFEQNSQLAKDFLRAQKELSRSFLKEKLNKKDKGEDELLGEVEPDEEEETALVDPLGGDKKSAENTEKHQKRVKEFFGKNIENYFGEKDDSEDEVKTKRNEETIKEELDEAPWWDLGALRLKRSTRSLKLHIPEESWRNNVISRELEDELTPLGTINTRPEEQLSIFGYRVEDANKEKTKKTKDNVDRRHDNVDDVDEEERIISNKLVATVKQKVSRLVNIVTRHVTEWYKTLTSSVDDDAEDTHSTRYEMY